MKPQSIAKSFLTGICLSFSLMLMAQGNINYDESKVPAYVLPDVLTLENGTKVSSSADWSQKRRPEIFWLYETQVFGKSPEHFKASRFRVLSEDKRALGGIATRREIAMYFSDDESHYTTILIYLPNKRNAPVPLFFGLNFDGNHTINADQGITISKFCLSQGDKMAQRGSASSRWPVEMLMEKGYGLATIHNSDIEPDEDNGFQKGLHPLFYKEGQTKPEADEWGTIAAWSFGMSRAMDYFETDKDIDSKKVIVLGHSRNGKAALWAGAVDKRFAMVVSNDSGHGGAALFRRKIGETVQVLNTAFPYWFCGNFKQYSDKEYLLPVDQHELIALIAPRPVYIASAQEDLWADPKGEFLSGVHASPVYELFGLKGLPSDVMPDINTPLLDGYIGYHIRPGEHDIKLYDWEQFVKFADKFLF